MLEMTARVECVLIWGGVHTFGKGGFTKRGFTGGSRKGGFTGGFTKRGVHVDPVNPPVYGPVFDNGRQAVHYKALIQFVEVTQKGNWSEVFGPDGSFPGFRRATTRTTIR